MDKEAVKDMLYGGLNELVHNEKYFRYSEVGPEYCKFREQGESIVAEFIRQMSVNIYKAEEAALNKRAKDMVIKGLKGETV